MPRVHAALNDSAASSATNKIDNDRRQFLRQTLMLIAAATAFATPALAQQAPAPAPADAAAAPAPGGAPAGVTVGATIKDQSGGTVGTIQSIGNGTAVLSTGKVSAALPFASFASTPNGAIIALTKDQLEQQVTQQSQAQIDQALRVGAVVRGPGGNTVGTIDSITGDQVVLATPKVKAQIAKSALSADANGLLIGETQAQLEASVAAATHGGAAPRTSSASGG